MAKGIGPRVFHISREAQCSLPLVVSYRIALDIYKVGCGLFPLPGFNGLMIRTKVTFKAAKYSFSMSQHWLSNRARLLVLVLFGLVAEPQVRCQNECSAILYGRRHFVEMNAAIDADKEYPCTEIDVDSLDCAGALYMTAYAKELGCPELMYHCVAKLVEQGGFAPSTATRQNIILGELFEGPDSAAYWQLIDSLYPKFIQVNATRLEAIDAIRGMLDLDQSRIWIFEFGNRWQRRVGLETTDTPSSFIEQSIDSLNFAQLLSICKNIGELPLSDKYGWGTTGTVRLLLLHAADGPSFHSTWRAIWPYVNEAMEGCRVGDDFLTLYDQTRLLTLGEQWFGTMGDRPIFPGELPLERRNERRIE